MGVTHIHLKHIGDKQVPGAAADDVDDVDDDDDVDDVDVDDGVDTDQLKQNQVLSISFLFLIPC